MKVTDVEHYEKCFVRQNSRNNFLHCENPGVNKSFILWTIKFFGPENLK